MTNLKNINSSDANYENDFFGKKTNLTVSGQLEAELAALGLGRVYTFGPTFRAENSNTSRHLAEFWMIEPEVAFYDLKKNAALAEDFLKYCINYCLEHCKNDLLFLEQRLASEESSLKKTTSEQSQLENENKIRGIEKGIKSNKTEAGSIQGKGYQKVTCLNCVEPKYPKLAIKRGYEGVLKLEILILKSGIVKEVFIKKSTGYDILDKAGVSAAFESKFYPLTKKTNLNIEYTLKLNRR